VQRVVFCLALVLLSDMQLSAHAAEDVVVEADRHGERFDVRARAVVAAPPAVVWQVLTDYERLPQFIPGITKSLVRRRQGNRLLLDQTGEARFLLFTFPIEVQLDVVEWPPDWIASRAVGGNVRRMNGRYELRPSLERGTVLLYYGEIELDFKLPPIVGSAALRGTVEQQFTAMVAEVERRAASSR
jgi:ribosome-associated toxin RatA of RatAB toxin-antitoxin module